ncbi:zinc finger protein 333-like [Trichogramma pretiosum]|uniref:zinc finger protein 333-like n=1 Tax=Trichogramma pretiosum TaxID=7493 RepID=UPI0006C98FCE|nr:zinc finger protein 333-like [Trichogramma pretiosum]
MDAMGDSINRLFICEFCRESFTEIGLKRHMDELRDKINKPVNSKILNDVLSLQNDLERRKNIKHNRKKTLKWVMKCHKTFGHKDHLKKDIDSTHNQGEFFDCKTCGLSYQVEGNFILHVILVHNESKLFECETCHKSFYSQGNLNAHKQKNRCKPFQCNICPNRFKTEENLIFHIQSWHPKDKPFKCKFCLASFDDQKTLNNHTMTVHRDIKPYKCEFCLKSFRSNGHLKRHLMKVHKYMNFSKILPTSSMYTL